MLQDEAWPVSVYKFWVINQRNKSKNRMGDMLSENIDIKEDVSSAAEKNSLE